MARIILALVVLTAPLSLTAADDDVRKELGALKGTWKTVAAEAAGTPVPKDALPPFTWIIAADGKSTARLPQGDFPVTITVDPTKNPKCLVNLHQSGNDKGKRQYGVYKLEGDRLTICVTPPGADENTRPKDFATKGTPYVLIVMERLKEEQKP
jgi:uncharacterized protein (TIGR03067 family)